MTHHHSFTDEGINVMYCTKGVKGKKGEICPIAKDKKTKRIGKFIVINGQGMISDSGTTKQKIGDNE